MKFNIGDRVAVVDGIVGMEAGMVGAISGTSYSHSTVKFDKIDGLCSVANKAIELILDDLSISKNKPKYPPQSASSFLTDAEKTMQQRASQHDSPEGERSMGKTVAAFNAITGRDLTESEGWLLMLILKQVRQWQKIDYHADSAIDSVAYSALLAESLAAGK